MQIEPRYVKLTETCFVAPPEKIAAAWDKNTIGVVGILGTTYSGHYEDVAGIDAEISELSSHVLTLVSPPVLIGEHWLVRRRARSCLHIVDASSL